MGDRNEFADAPVMPQLTLEPVLDEKEEIVAKPEEPEEPQLDDSVLSEEERQMVQAFASQIDLTKTEQILQYGAGTQKKMADFS